MYLKYDLKYSMEEDGGLFGIFGIEGDGFVVSVEVGAEIAEEDVSEDNKIFTTAGEFC